MSEHRSGAPGLVKEVTSLSNPLVKDIKALALKKFRDQQNAFLAEGLKLVLDALELGWSIRTLVFAKSAIGNPLVQKVAARTVAAGGLVLEVSEKVLTAITRRDNPQMVVGVFAQRYLSLKDIHPGGNEVWVALDRVRDPGNLGTVIRTVDAVGASGVILVGDCTDPFSIETVRATILEGDRPAVRRAKQYDRLVADAPREELSTDHLVRECRHLPAVTQPHVLLLALDECVPFRQMPMRSHGPGWPIGPAPVAGSSPWTRRPSFGRSRTFPRR